VRTTAFGHSKFGKVMESGGILKASKSMNPAIVVK